MSKNTLTASESKFTKGEKCIFSHLVLTFTMILILIVIFGIHLYIIRHTLYGIFNTRRSSLDTKRKSGFENQLVGYLYLNGTTNNFVCNTLLLRSRWSLSTAHCVAIRTEPDMAHLLFAWGIKYKLVHKDITGQQTALFITSVKRSIAHSLFNRETFANNVGLLEHTQKYPLSLPNLNNAAFTLNSEDRKNIFITGWHHNNIENIGNHNVELISYDVRHVSTENCLEALSPVTIVRSNEFCVTLQIGRQAFLDYGAVMFINTKAIGIFSWGERIQRELPMVIINVTLFKDWLKIIDIS